MRFLACGALLLVACTSVQVEQIDVPATNADYFFWIAYDQNQAPLRASAVFGLDGKKIVFGGDPLFELQEGEAGAAAIAFTREELRAIHGGFLSDRAEQLSVSLSAPPATPVLFDQHAIAAIPANAQILGAELPSIRELLALSLPIDPEYCTSVHGTRLSPYGATGQLLPPSLVLPDEPPGTQANATLRRLIRAIPIDADRVLVASEHLIFVVRRGRPFTEPAFRPADLEPEALDVYGIAIGETKSNGAITVYAIGNARLNPTIFELELGGEGHGPDVLRFIETATVVKATRGAKLLDLLFDKNGNLIATGEDNMVLVRARGESSFVRRPPVTGDTDYTYWKVIDSNDPAQPHVLTENNGRLFSGDAVRGEWELFERDDRFDNRRFYALGASPDGREHWAGGPKGSLFVRTEDLTWRRVDLSVPPRFTPCATIDNDGKRVFTSTIRAIALDDEAGYLALSDCNAMLRVTRNDHCVSVLTAEDTPVALDTLDWQSAEIHDGELLTAGSNGLLYTFPTSP